jgi:hypothetical protein
MANVCMKQSLGQIDGVPETKTEWEGIIPHVYTRTSTLVAYLEACGDDDLLNQVWGDITSCAEIAIAGAVLAAIFTDTAGAAPGFTATFEPCLAAKIGERFNEIGFSLSTQQEATEWQQRT